MFLSLPRRNTVFQCGEGKFHLVGEGKLSVMEPQSCGLESGLSVQTLQVLQRGEDLALSPQHVTWVLPF